MNNKNSTIALHNLEDTKKIAYQLASHTLAGDVFCMKGNIGVGKTTFCQFFIEYFLPKSTALSPTFSIINSYDTKKFSIYHLDLYRIQNPQELIELGLDEILNNNVALIEWSENLKNYFIYNPIYLTLSVQNNIHYIDIACSNESQFNRFFPK